MTTISLIHNSLGCHSQPANPEITAGRGMDVLKGCFTASIDGLLHSFVLCGDFLAWCGDDEHAK